MRILALDTGTRCGWAFFDGFQRESGVQVFDVKRGESPGMRYLRFNRWLEEVWGGQLELGLGPSRAELVVYEQTHNRGGAATEVAAGFATRVQEACARWGINHAAIHSGTLKKWTTGSGAAGKPEMRQAVLRRWGVDYLDDNEVDAIALLEWAREHLVADSLTEVGR